VVKVPPVSGVVYRVKDKETIDAIASKFHISASSIFEQNRLNPSSPLQKDQELIIPG
jgi:LysM repeat protein